MKNVVIVDIDGTLARVGDRLKYIQGENKDWDSFYEDCFDDHPIEEVLELVHSLHMKYHVVFCTGRRESVRAKTKQWLRIHLYKDVRADIPDSVLIMRPNRDIRHDVIVKPEMLLDAGYTLNEIAFVLEDRDSMVKKWRELGVKCFQVAEGDF